MKKIYCKKCNYYITPAEQTIPRGYQCYSPHNLEEKEDHEEKYKTCKEHPMDLNKNNDCKFFKKRFLGFVKT